jgi:rhodanese-related sulfurtransferase
MDEIALETFAVAHAAGAFVIDVREVGEYVSGHVPGARLIPLTRLSSALADLPRAEPVYVICASGNRSKAAAGFLHGAGINGISVADGTGGWVRTGRPVVLGVRER